MLSTAAQLETSREPTLNTRDAPGLGAEGAAWHRPRLSIWWALIFIVGYGLAAELGSEFTTKNDVSPWYLPVGLSLGLLLIVGWPGVPVVFAADALQLLVRGTASPADAIVEALSQAVLWGLVGAALRPFLRADAPLSRLRDAGWFAVIGVLLGPLVVAVAGVAVFVLIGETSSADYVSTTTTFYVGDAIGVLAITPAILVLTGWAPRAQAAWRAVRGSVAGTGWEGWAMLASTVAVPVATVSLFHGDLLPLISVPMVWIALRRGMPTAALATAIWSYSAVAAFAGSGPGVSLNGISASLVGGGLFALFAGAVVTERERGRARFAYLALHDDVTGLPNLRRFTQQVDEALGRSDRTDIAVLLVRLAGLQSLTNLELAEPLLRRAAHRLRRSTGADATLARVGTGLFVILVEGPDARDVARVADGVLQALRRPVAIDGREYLLEPIIGSGTASEGQSSQELLQDALVAAGVAASTPARTAAFDDHLSEAHREQNALGRALAGAFQREELQLHYQPILGLSDGLTIGVEALLRWTDAERGAIEPAEFVAVAEAVGLMLPIGRWVLREACTTVAAWPDSRSGLVVHVNVSAVQLRDEGLGEFVREVLAETGLAAERLCLELTASALVDDLDLAADRIRELAAVGVRVVLDDFGTSASSVAWLHDLPVSALKLDRSFVHGIEERALDWAIVGATLGLARAIELDTVAEGVETHEQLDALRNLGCDAAQGFLLCEPLPDDELLAWLAGAPG